MADPRLCPHPAITSSEKNKLKWEGGKQSVAPAPSSSGTAQERRPFEPPGPDSSSALAPLPRPLREDPAPQEGRGSPILEARGVVGEAGAGGVDGLQLGEAWGHRGAARGPAAATPGRHRWGVEQAALLLYLQAEGRDSRSCPQAVGLSLPPLSPAAGQGGCLGWTLAHFAKRLPPPHSPLHSPTPALYVSPTCFTPREPTTHAPPPMALEIHHECKNIHIRRSRTDK